MEYNTCIWFALLALLATAATRQIRVAAAPVDEVQVLRLDISNVGVDGYKFGYETSDGVRRDEEGVIKNPGTDAEALSVHGTISWIAPDGETYTITFVADENGYQPEGAHLPK